MEDNMTSAEFKTFMELIRMILNSGTSLDEAKEKILGLSIYNEEN